MSLLSITDFHQWRMPGDSNAGHESLACMECHEAAPGTIRQQIQANVQYFTGLRQKSVAFNYERPNNSDCLACHEREDDKHPVYRFNEPRFLEARKAIQPQYCVSCHQEHTGVRVSSDPENCRFCHDDIEVNNDPLDISHATLIESDNWSSCLRCHDFHGNHEMAIAVNTSDMLQADLVMDYFAGGKNPYSVESRSKAKETRYEN